jgi:hypothetical protein
MCRKQSTLGCYRNIFLQVRYFFIRIQLCVPIGNSCTGTILLNWYSHNINIVINYHCDYLYLEVRCSIKLKQIFYSTCFEEFYTCMAPKLKFNKNTVDSFVSMGKIIRPKHIVICRIKLSSYLIEKYFL